LFRYEIAPDGAALRVTIDLIGPLRLVPAGRGNSSRGATRHFRLRLPPDGAADRFEFDWGEVRSTRAVGRTERPGLEHGLEDEALAALDVNDPRPCG